MADDTDWKESISHFLRELPIDLVAVVLFVLVADIATLAPVINETPLRIILGFPLVLFLPGYALVATLFPETDHSSSSESDTTSSTETDDVDDSRPVLRNGIDGIERIALSFGLSVAISPLIGLVINFTSLGVELVPIVLAVSGFTLLMSGTAMVRRWWAPAGKRFRVPYQQWYTDLHEELFQSENRIDAVLNLVLVISLVLAVSSVSYALLFPKDGESFTGLSLYTENESGGLVASGYPQNITVGESKPLIIEVENHERQSIEYTLIVELQRLRTQNDSTRVVEAETLNRFSPSVENEKTWRKRHRIEPLLTGQRLRLTYLLYRGDPPAEPTVSNAYREAHIWINVSSG